MNDALSDPIRVAVVDETGKVTNAVMATALDVPAPGFLFIEDEACLSIPGDAWNGINFISPEGIIRIAFAPEVIGPANNPEPESL